MGIVGEVDIVGKVDIVHKVGIVVDKTVLDDKVDKRAQDEQSGHIGHEMKCVPECRLPCTCKTM